MAKKKLLTMGLIALMGTGCFIGCSAVQNDAQTVETTATPKEIEVTAEKIRMRNRLYQKNLLIRKNSR